MRTLSCLGCLLLLASAPVVAAPVYKWKDANGVTQYSETPPAGKAFETREQARGPASRASTAETTETPVPEQCANARANLALLDGKGPVVVRDAEGKAAAPLTEEQRATQRGLADAAIKAYCPPAG
ncbi:DUF4124 domain-containing protein [Stenotrophomonas sp. 24(2023)]|uniref:DUF4124 domain-containing protein n=1 Tax=Stenotrophomonas sp. 24(2023) TaxID=3068324 RepID=UPI0027DF6D95|nr:DUF4124 domain-containing protein [Stenotrophomonas sp. 24(2023)]WMJ67761.1 DUF4124 domain-containing protein [Stenotrophomonas sp. 24(2023)]